MVQIAAFEVEQWMAEHDVKAKYNISESCSSPISVNQLQSLSVDPSVSPISLDVVQDYGPIRGSQALRTNIANLYPASGVDPANVLVTPGAIQANFLVIYALIGPGDHVICHYPTYQQLYSVPESLGASVSLWKAEEEHDWRLDVNELEGLITPQTKLVILNNPNNPTGSFIPKSDLKKIVEIASAKNIFILSDEVYKPMFHSLEKDDPELPPSILQMGYRRVIVTSSMSKSYSLAGLRLGWIAALESEVIEKCFQVRDYTTISCPVISDYLAAYALTAGTVDTILERNNALARKKLQILDGFIKQYPDKISYVKPKAGTTAFVCFKRNGIPVEGDEFCLDVTDKTGVFFVPGKRCFGNGKDYEGHVRIGYVCKTEVLEQALEHLKGYIENEL